MTEPKITPQAEAEWLDEEKRHTAAFVAFIQRWPHFRREAAFGLLGSAVAAVDMMGGDVEGFVAELRRRQPKPAPIVPRRSS